MQFQSQTQLEYQYGEAKIVLDIEAEKEEAQGKVWRVRLPDGTEHRLQVTSRPDNVLHIIEINEVETRKIAEEVETPETSEAVEKSEAIEKEELAQSLQTFRVPFARLESGKGVSFSYEGMTYTFHKSVPGVIVGKSEAVTGVMSSPMAGIIVDILVTEGQTVAAYQPLVVIEAMKVMTTLEAPFAGVVKSLHVQLKQQIAHDAPVIEVVKL